MHLMIRSGVFIFLFSRVVLFADVNGDLKVEGEPVIYPKHAVAFPVRDQFNPREWETEVVLAEGAIDASFLRETMDPHAEVIGQEAVTSGSYIVLWIGRNGLVSMNATLSSTLSQLGHAREEGVLVARLTINGRDRIAGRVFTRRPVKTMKGETFEVDVTFDAAIIRSISGTKLPRGGGEPGKAFQAFYQAMQRYDAGGIESGLTQNYRKMLFRDPSKPEENLKSAIRMLSAWLPKNNYTISGGELRGEAALLEIEGELYEGTKALYIVKMVKGPFGWLFDGASTAGVFRSHPPSN